MLRPEPVTRAIFPSSLLTTPLHDNVGRVGGIRTRLQPAGRLHTWLRQRDGLRLSAFSSAVMVGAGLVDAALADRVEDRRQHDHDSKIKD